MSYQRFIAVLAARNREFLRDRTAISWSILMPVLIVMGFAFAFTTDRVDLFKVGIHQGEEQTTPEVARFLTTRHIQFILINDLKDAVIKVERHQLDMLLDPVQQHYWINDSSANGYILEQLLNLKTSVGRKNYLTKQTVSGKEIRYVDWLIPGVLGMNIMFSSLFGVGYVIVRYRKNGVLKRLRATPLTTFEFLSAQMASRLWLIVLVTIMVYLGTNLFINFHMSGSYPTLFLVLLLGTLSMISMSLIVAARMSNQEGANGVLNLISWPMMMLSGVWFSLEGSPVLVQKLALLLPLTHITDAARAVMIDGAGLMDIAGNLIALLLMTLIFLLIGAYSFRWE